MYRVLIADDEGIMLESLKTIIRKNYENCEIETAKTGRAAIEQAEFFHPDIVFMDIQMPGINGIEAMKEIRASHRNALFYILSAYDKFDYAKEAISLGVERYLMKPVTKSMVIQIMDEAIRKVDDMRRRHSDQLKVQEKLETVIPVVENGFISHMLIGSPLQDASYYKQLLDITEDYGYVILFQFASETAEGKPISPVRVSVEAQEFIPEFRAVVKSFLRCVVGGIISDRIAVAVPCLEETTDYEQRIRMIDQAREISNRLEERLGIRFRAGIGRIRKLEALRTSYQEADQALRESNSHVIHINDIISRGMYEGDFPAELEHSIFRALELGKVEETRLMADRFFNWMIRSYPESRNNIRLKVLEYVLNAEKSAFREGAVNYGFELRENYLTEVMELQDYEQLRVWFLEKLTQACRSIHDRRENQSESAVAKAKNYIREHFESEISLDEVSREVNISPYYFSKLFKEESGETFIEYLTRLRIERARELLRQSDDTIKEISIAVGYADPNYFSRIFKKQTGMTPREFREEGTGEA